MPKGDFLWCDLSTFHVTETKNFYTQLFGWVYETVIQSDGSPYYIASSRHGESAAIFEMPQKFQRLGLPSFWMSYIAVDDAGEAVDRARRLGGKVELDPVAFGDGGSIALIRDPLGAGFTVYQGADLGPRLTQREPGRMAWNALYVSDAKRVVDFYQAIFDWRISQDPARPNLFRVFNANGDEISAIHELPDEIRGKYQFWGVHFATADVSAAEAQVTRCGGKILYHDLASDDPTVLAQDPDGAAFFLTEAKTRKTSAKGHLPTDDDRSKWKTVLGLLVIWIAVVMELNWVWGILFIMWTIAALRTGQTFFVEPISRRSNAVLFWLIVITWIVLSLYLIFADLEILVGTHL